MGILQQEYWSGLPCPAPVDLPNPGIKLLLEPDCLCPNLGCDPFLAE